MLLLLATLPAQAAPDLQARLLPSAFELAEAQVEALDPSLAEPVLSVDKVDCYDTLGILDFNLDVPIDDVELDLGAGTLGISVDLGLVWGEAMTVYGLDEDYFDTCAEFEGDLLWISLADGHLEGTLTVDTAAVDTAEDGGLALSWAEAPVVTGDLDMDIDWFPDDLVLFFIEDALFDGVSEALATDLLPELEAFAAEPLLDGDYADYGVFMALASAQAGDEGLALGIDAEVAYLGTPACDVGTGSGAGGDAPDLDLDPPAGAEVMVGLTERFVDALLVESWESGAFCAEVDAFGELVEDLAAFLDTDAVVGDGWGELTSPPVLSLSADGARLRLDGLRVTLTGELDGSPATLVDTAMDIEGTAVLALSDSGTSLVLQLVDMDIDFATLDLDGVQDGMEGWVQGLVEAWVADKIEAELSEVPLFDAAYQGYGLFLRIDQVAVEDGGLAIALSLYDEDDPAIDRTAPDTTAELAALSGDSATLSWSGTDDQSAALSFSTRLDGGGWSDWTDERETTIDDLLPGTHWFEVKARDAWLNEDQSPARVTVEVNEAQTGADKLAEACGCTSGGASGAGLLLGLLAAVRRRR